MTPDILKARSFPTMNGWLNQVVGETVPRCSCAGGAPGRAADHAGRLPGSLLARSRPLGSLFRDRRLRWVQAIRMLAGPRDPVAGLGARLCRCALDRGASLHLVDEGADLPGLGPGFDLAFEQVTALQLLAASLLGFDPLTLCLLPLARVSLGLKTLGTLGVSDQDKAEHDVVEHVFERTLL